MNFVKYKTLSFFIICIFLNTLTFAQNKKKLDINFIGNYNGNNLILNQFYKLDSTKADSISFSAIKFYISNISLLNDDKKVLDLKNVYHLIDLKNKTSFKLSIPVNFHYNTIQFNIGIDSITNSKGVLGGDLDPTKGMYWTWHSGYINLKIEGNSNLCSTRNNQFQFHLGGYKSPFNSLQEINLTLKNKTKVDIDVDLYKLISTINLSNVNHIMTPSSDAKSLSQLATTMFSIK